MNFMWTTPKVHCGTRVLALFEEKMLCPCIIHRSLHQSRYHLCLSDEFQMKFKGERFEYALLFDRGVIVMASVELSYYYGYEAEQFSFYRIPKLLFTDSRFAGISTDAKLVLDNPPPKGKDYNDYLQIQKGIAGRVKTRGGEER